jgi:hypothetical protein
VPFIGGEIVYLEDDMKHMFAAAILMLTAGNAFAQTPPANPNAKTPAVATSNTTNPGAPVPGSNSFTEAQAKSRIEAAGYSDISGLMKDKDGIWRGKASKAGKSQTVSLDYQGNVTAN